MFAVDGLVKGKTIKLQFNIILQSGTELVVDGIYSVGVPVIVTKLGENFRNLVHIKKR